MSNPKLHRFNTFQYSGAVFLNSLPHCLRVNTQSHAKQQSAIMSLMLKKKGGKVFAPKFPQRRPGAPPSAQSSARPSVERQSQTPAPHAHPIETITIPDGDDTPDLSIDPSRIVEITPRKPILELPRDALPHAHPTEASAHNASAYAPNAAILPNKESLKRKTRDADAEVEVSHKRHQSSSLDAPTNPSQSAPVEQSQAANSQLQLAQLSERTRLATPEPTQSESQSVQPPTPPKAVPPARNDVHIDDEPASETSMNVKSSEAIPQATETTAPASHRHPLQDNTGDSSEDGSEDESSSNSNTNCLGLAGVAPGLGAAGDVGSGAEGGRLAQTPVIVPMAPLNPDGTPGEPLQQPAIGTKKRVPKRRKVQEAEDGDDGRATVEMQLNRPRRAPSKKQARKKKDDAKKKNKRAETPEGAEDEEINREEIKMSELCKDLRIGQKFSRHDELRQREKQKIIKAQLAKTHPELASMVEGPEGGEEGDEAGEVATALAEGEAREEAEQPVLEGGGPRMRIVDGQIVMDDNSMQIDRQKIARTGQGEIEEIEEHEFSKITTSGTYMKRERAQLWDMAANEIFWKGLRMFGTDFEMISKMFPHRNRRQIKLKFNKEEKDNPAKIDRILKAVGNSIELDTYEELSGVKLEEVADIEAERERIEAEQKAEEERRTAEQAEAERKKKAAIAAEKEAARRILATADDDDEAGESGDGDYGGYGNNGDSGEKENQPRRSQSNDTSPKPLVPGEKQFYHWTRKSEAETARELQEVREKEGPQKNIYAWTRAPKASKPPKPKKHGTVRKQKKRGAADETVQVLGDA